MSDFVWKIDPNWQIVPQYNIFLMETMPFLGMGRSTKIVVYVNTRNCINVESHPHNTVDTTIKSIDKMEFSKHIIVSNILGWRWKYLMSYIIIALCTYQLKGCSLETCWIEFSLERFEMSDVLSLYRIWICMHI